MGRKGQKEKENGEEEEKEEDATVVTPGSEQTSWMDNCPNNKNKDMDTRTLGAPVGGEGWLTSSGRNSWTLVPREVSKNTAVS